MLALAIPSAATAAEFSMSLNPSLALCWIVLFVFTCTQLWLHRDAHKRPFAGRVFVTLASAALLTWIIATQVVLDDNFRLLALAVALTASLSMIAHITRLASFEGLRQLLLQEVAQKTINLEEKNLELKSTQQKLRIANIELKALSFTDSLTGAYNRLYFDRQFLTEWQRARREQEPLSMILVDIDHFKELNDKHGHLVGDNALKFITELLKKGFQRGNDIVCRYGGEEFVVLLPNTPPSQALIRAEKVRKNIEMTPFIDEDQVLPITASFGVGGLTPLPEHEPLGLLHASDQALYYVKRNGRNGCKLAEDISPTESQREESVAV